MKPSSLPSSLVSILLLSLAQFSPTSADWPVPKTNRYPDEHLIQVGSLGLPKTGLVAAFGDYNADQLLDLFFLSSDQRSLSVYIWDRPSYQWKEKIETRIRTTSDFVIANVVPGDYDYDGRLDVLLMGSKNPGGWWGSDETLEMQVYLQQTDGSFSTAVPVNSSGMGQPIPLDASGDMRTDLLGMSAEVATPMLWNNVWESSNHTQLYEVIPPLLEKLSSSNCVFPTPHSNAFIDLDGDCLADIFLTCQKSGSSTELTYQIWLNDKAGGFALARSGDLPRGTKSVGFADMDRDGTIDLVITSCTSSSKCELSIAYNSQVPLCTGSALQMEACRDPEALCVADPNFTFNFTVDDTNDDLTTISISDLVPSSSLVTDSTAFRGTLPTPPSIGDYNIDGYPDLLLLTSKSGSRSVNLLESQPCAKFSCTPGQIQKGRRAFKIVTEGAEALTTIKDAESAHWVDLDDDGSLDIMVQRTGSTGAARQVVFIKNNYFHDAFFLKALVLNGACQGWCEPKAVGESRYRPYGVSYSGASYKFTVLDPTGARKATQVGQLPQSGYLSLGTPYSYFGLGRTNNYVENLFIGSTHHQPLHFINIEGVIPNSQIVIDPYQPSGRTDPGSWSKELYLHPGDWIPWVTVALGAAIAFLGAIVVALHLNEKREDDKERRARLLSLNFQAL